MNTEWNVVIDSWDWHVIGGAPSPDRCCADSGSKCTRWQTFISSIFWLHFWKWPLVVHLSVSGLSLQWVLFASVIVLLSYLLSSHVSTRLCAAKARRRDSGSHSKKIKTQWGGEKMKYSLKWMWWNSSMTKQKKGRCETETNLRQLRGEWSCVRILDCCPLTVLPLSADIHDSSVADEGPTVIHSSVGSLCCTCNALFCSICTCGCFLTPGGGRSFPQHR